MPHKPFFRKHDGWWVVQMRQGQRRWQHKLCKGSPPLGKDTEPEAYQLFSLLMAEGAHSLPAPTKVRVHDVLLAVLEYSGYRRAIGVLPRSWCSRPLQGRGSRPVSVCFS
jgi:hypothetical protein